LPEGCACELVVVIELGALVGEGDLEGARFGVDMRGPGPMWKEVRFRAIFAEGSAGTRDVAALNDGEDSALR